MNAGETDLVPRFRLGQSRGKNGAERTERYARSLPTVTVPTDNRVRLHEEGA